jgi:hypothetical protein
MDLGCHELSAIRDYGGILLTVRTIGPLILGRALSGR